MNSIVRLRRGSRVAALPVVVLLLPVPLAAEEDSEDDGPRFEARVAGGPTLVPEFEGASRYELAPYFEAQVYYGRYHLALNGPRARVNVVTHKHINAGPIISYQRGRDDVDTAQVDRLDRIKAAVELGGFIEYANRHDDDPLAVERLRLMVRQDVTGRHSGALVSLRGVIQRDIWLGTVLALTAGATWASHDYMETYFGVSEPEAVRSGLAAFDANSGLKNVGGGVSINQFLSRHWSVGARFHYNRLTGDAADSPIVDDAGSANQFFGALVLGYRF